MGRPTLIDQLPAQQRRLAANMYHYNEPYDKIFKYIDMNDTPDARKSLDKLVNEMVEPLSEALYSAYLNLAETEQLIKVVKEKADEGSPPHIREFKNLSELRLKITKQIDELMKAEDEKGINWSPTFDEDAPEYRVFRASVELFFTKKREKDDQWDSLSPENQARFFQILAESE